MNGWHDLSDIIDLIRGAVLMMVCIAALAGVLITLLWAVCLYVNWLWA